MCVNLALISCFTLFHSSIIIRTSYFLSISVFSDRLVSKTSQNALGIEYNGMKNMWLVVGVICLGKSYVMVAALLIGLYSCSVLDSVLACDCYLLYFFSSLRSIFVCFASWYLMLMSLFTILM